ncbi:MBOAT family O-acyltransferase [Hahella ganghwensis]|uniref:MBOAT family O-acyltransferase n=1 Tax=Hahella ganghwensis TaxID=286420 RepID=UPI00037F24D9|nr:MBOAT family O-acyltransferase [Hahella ganghwensis]
MFAERTASTWPVWVAAVLLLGTLGFFKYAGFLGQILDDLNICENLGSGIAKFALPLGISFIVFQALGYVIDVHRREFSAERKFSVALLFKAFFPQLIAGPICRAHELIPQIKSSFQFSLPKLCSGMAIFAVGLFLKLVFADGLAPLVDSIFLSPFTVTRIEAWAAAGGFGAQIYADFWGYSTMAVGLARMFGIDIPVNFKLPYFATSIREFWRRWHITLSQWLRDYLYKSLGGSRHGQLRTILALFATMLLGGLWHGANYTFIVWGAIHGAVLAVEHLLGVNPNAGGQISGTRLFLYRLSRFMGWGYTFIVVMIAWVFFRATDVSQALNIVSAMFIGGDGGLSATLKQIAMMSLALFIVQVPVERLLGALREERLAPDFAVGGSLALILAAVVLGAPEAMQFIYFEF